MMDEHSERKRALIFFVDERERHAHEQLNVRLIVWHAVCWFHINQTTSRYGRYTISKLHNNILNV